MADMLELIARLETAEAGSRELDAAIWAWEQPEPIKVRGAINADGYRSQVFFTLPPKRMERATKNTGPYRHADPVTTSLDAALALAERVLEERGPININVCLAGSAQAQIYPTDPCGPHVQAVAPTPALALCIAILKAKEGGNHVG